MIRFSGVWYWVLIAIVVVLAASITILFGEINDVPVLEETNSPDTLKEADPVTEDKLQPKDPAPRGTTVNVDPSNKVELQQLFNELRKEYLDTRAKSIDWWLEFIAIVLAFFAILIAIAGYVSFREFRRLRNEAKLHVSEIHKDKVESDELLKNIRQRGRAEVFDRLSNSTEFEGRRQELLQNSDLSVIDKAIVEASVLQQRGDIDAAIEKWHSIANIVEESDKDLASHAWFSAGYLYSQEEEPEKAILAYDKAIILKPDYAEAYNSRGVSKGVLGHYESAISDLDEAINLDSHYAEAYYNRGIVKFKDGSYYLASHDFDETIRLNPQHIHAYINRGLSNFNQGHYEEAYNDLDKAVSLEQNNVEAYYNRGRMGYLIIESDSNFTNIDDATLLEMAKLDFRTALNLAIQQGRTEFLTIIEEHIRELNDIE